MEDISRGYAGVTLEWLYDTIQQRSIDALLNSHKTFVAARKIQIFTREWISQLSNKRKNEVATIIQKYCRGWLARKHYYKYLKDMFLERVMCYYNKMARRIQAFWRGYWSRAHIHDHIKLRNAQEEAAKDLIICIAHRLHYMLRTKISPGVYSIRNTHCLSKVERLLASMQFTSYSREVRKLNLDQINLIQNSIKNTETNMGMVRIPYLDSIEACKAIGGNKMTAMLDKYHYDAKQEDSLINKKTCLLGRIKKEKKLKKEIALEKLQIAKEKKHKSFCANIVNSMTNWGIIKDDKHFIVCPGVTQKPDNIIGFINDVETIIEKKGIN